MKKARKEGPRGEVRISGGELRGRKVRLARDDVRPTQDRVREAIFSSIAPGLPGARVLDLFAGTGAMGLEAWSRGAAEVWFVEQDRRLFEALRAATESLCAGRGATHCVCEDVYAFLARASQRLPRFDFVLADPPYDDGGPGGAMEKTLSRLGAKSILKASGLVVFEQSAQARVPEVAGWRIVRDRRYGSTRVLTLRPEPEPEEQGGETT